MTCSDPMCYLDECDGTCGLPDPAPWSSVCSARDEYWAALGAAKNEVIGEDGPGCASAATIESIDRAAAVYARSYCDWADAHSPGWRDTWPIGAPSGMLRQLLEDGTSATAPTRSAESEQRSAAWMQREVS